MSRKRRMANLLHWIKAAADGVREARGQRLGRVSGWFAENDRRDLRDYAAQYRSLARGGDGLI